MKYTASLKKLSLVAIFVLLAACGGGNSSSGDKPDDDVGGAIERDTTPDQFSFEGKEGVAVGAVVQSSTITVTGINEATPISIIGGQYRINSGGYTAADGRVVNGDKVTLQVESPKAENTSVEAVLTIGQVSAVFRVSTGVDGALPDAIYFKPVTSAMPGTVVESNEVVVSGIDTAVALSISGGQYAINSGPYTASAGTIANGQTLRVRLTSATTFGESRSASLTVGKLSTSFTVTSRVSPDLLDLGITFPPQNALTDAESITVRGIASSAATVASVSVNGIEASSTDGFETWYASVELANGENQIEATVNDTAGNLYSHSVSLRNTVVLDEVEQLVLSEDGAKAYLSNYADTGLELLSIDRSTGDAQRLFSYFDTDVDSLVFDVVSANQRMVVADVSAEYANRIVDVDIESGVSSILYENIPSESALMELPFAAPNGVIPHPGHADSVLVVDEGREELHSLNLTTGRRTLISGRNRGTTISGRVTGPRQVMPYPGDSTRVLVSDACTCGGDGLVAYDLITGDRTEVSTRGSFVDIQGIAVHPGDSNQVMVADLRDRRLFSVDLTTAEETVVSDRTRGSGTMFGKPWGIVAHPAAADTVVVSDSETGLLLAVNLSTGDRNVISGPGTGEGSPFAEPRGVIVNPVDTGQLLVVDNALKAVFSVDITTGDRTIISGFHPSLDEQVGHGLNFFSPQGISVDPRRSDSVLVTDGANGGVYSVNLGNGDRLELGSKVDANETLGYASAIEMDSAGNRAFISHPMAKALVEHRLDDGSRRIVASGVLSPMDIAIDEHNQRIYVLGEQLYIEVISFDGASRQIVSGRGVGEGPELVHPSRLVIDSKNDVLLVIDNGREGLYRIDITTGDRTLVSTDSRPSWWGELAYDADRNTVVGLGRFPIARVFDLDLNSGVVDFIDHFNVTQVGEPRLYSPAGLAYLQSTQMLLVADPLAGSLQIVNPKDGMRRVLPTNAGEGAISQPPFAVLPHPSNSELILIGFTGQAYDSIYTADLETGELRLVSGGDSESRGAGSRLRFMKKLTYFPGDATRILAWDHYGDAIAVDLSSGDRTEISSSLGAIGGVTVRPGDSSQVFATESSNNQLVSLDIDSGEKTVISSSTVGAGINLYRPTGVSPHPNVPGQILVGLDSYDAPILSVDLSTGDRTLISGGGIGSGPKMRAPDYITHSHLKPDTIWVSDREMGIFEVDLVSGDRVILSR